MWGEGGIGYNSLGTYWVGYSGIVEAWNTQMAGRSLEGLTALSMEGSLQLASDAFSLVGMAVLFLFGMGLMLITTVAPAAIYVASSALYLGVFGLVVALSWLINGLVSLGLPTQFPGLHIYI
jgi:hypothetical protein